MAYSNLRVANNRPDITVDSSSGVWIIFSENRTCDLETENPDDCATSSSRDVNYKQELFFIERGQLTKLKSSKLSRACYLVKSCQLTSLCVSYQINCLKSDERGWNV